MPEPDGHRFRVRRPWAWDTQAFRTGTFKTALLASGVLVTGTLLLFGFIYWQTAGYESDRIAQFVLNEAAAIAREPPQSILTDVETRFADDLHRLTFAAVLARDGRVVAGDMVAYPAGLPRDSRPHVVQAEREIGGRIVIEQVTATARSVQEGRILVVGRSRRDLSRLTVVVVRALALGLIPAVLLALSAGIWASKRSLARVAAFRHKLDSIIEGGLKERLPVGDTRDTFNALAASVNATLDELSHLLGELRGVGDSIAHDLRTPLTRARARLEGGRRRAMTLADLDEVASGAIADLDQCFSVITALLRIAEIDAARRRSGFTDISLTDIVIEAGELYQPVAELRQLGFTVTVAADQRVFADRDLLFEVCANLLDNAIKFTPEGGSVVLALAAEPAGPTVRVSDSGPGIPAVERDAVRQRFYRTAAASRTEGSGLGLSLAAAILRLHGFALTMRDDLPPGFTVEIVCRAAERPS